MDEDVTDEAAGCSESDPSTAAGFVAVVVALPGELGAGGSVPRAITNIEEALHGDEGDLAVRCALEGEVGLFAEVEDVVVPDVHFDDAPAAGEGLGESGGLGHQPGSARSRGRQTSRPRPRR